MSLLPPGRSRSSHGVQTGHFRTCKRWLGPLLCALITQTTAAGDGPPSDRIIFGGEANYPPFEWLEEGRAQGFNVDLARVMVEGEGVASSHELGNWPGVLKALDQGQIDAVPMFYSEARAARYRFTMPFHHVDHAIFGRQTSTPVTGIDQLVGYRIAVESRSYAHDALSGDLGLEIVSVQNTLDALLAVEADAADYAVLSAPTADHLIRARGLDLERIGPTFWPRPYAFAVREDRPDLAEWLNRSIQRTIAKGEFGGVYERWRQELAPGERGTLPRWLVLALLSATVIAAIAGGWVLALRRTVARRTSDLRAELERRRLAESAARRAAAFDHHGLARPHQFRAEAAQVLAANPALNEALVIKLGTFEQTIRTLDHDTGTALIDQFAARLRSLHLPACGRLSRDVFGVLTRPEDSDRLVEKLSDRLPVGSLSIYPNLRIGRARRADNAMTAEELIRCAEIALLEAIESHRDMVAYHASMQGNHEDLRLIGEFQASGGSELFAQFQPIIDVRSGNIAGAEALVRWRHPELGDISPARFVPLLEQAGLIHIVTERMLGEAIRVVSLARRIAPTCCVSVNVTPNDLTSPQMRDLVEQLLQEHSVSPDALKLELTETSVVAQPDLVRESLQSFQSLGVGLAVDDFGTGHSSLTHLTSFPLSELKIDREFISVLRSDARRRSIVMSTLSMAKELGLAVVAEGVEDQCTLALLRHLGCNRAQGFGISRPLLEADFLNMLRRNAQHGESEPFRQPVGHGGNI